MEPINLDLTYPVRHAGEDKVLSAYSLKVLKITCGVTATAKVVLFTRIKKFG